ncbi:AcrA Membrane-fusion protein [Rhabdaerophilaceae bacterium]
MSNPLFSRRFLAIVALLSAGGVGSWMVVSHPAAQSAPPKAAAPVERPVLVQKVILTTLAQPRVLVGTVRARIEADHGFRLAGKVATRQVQTGDRVKQGMVLATLDPTDLRLQRETAEAELAAARASERQAASEITRINELRQKGWSTDQSLDRQKAAVEEAIGRRKRAERNASLAANAQSYAELKAEADGIVIAVNVEPGQVVAAGQAVFRIAHDGDREAQVAVPEQEIDDIRLARATATLWTEPGRLLTAQLRELSPNADVLTRTFQARFTLSGLAPDTPLGMSVSLTVSPAEAQPVARIPLSAVLNEGAGPEVYIVDEQSRELQRRKVVVKAYESRDAIVSSGLKDGDVVVILGIHKLKPGQKVTTITDMRLG